MVERGNVLRHVKREGELSRSGNVRGQYHMSRGIKCLDSIPVMPASRVLCNVKARQPAGFTVENHVTRCIIHVSSSWSSIGVAN